MIKVLMCTYNGAKYLDEQLESIFNQTRRPDELICLDDNSSDDTAEIFRNFVKKNNIDNWKIEINSANVGWRENFRRIMSRGYDDNDILFFADQDDVWERDKIAEMSAIMENNDKILRLSSEQRLIDSDGRETEDEAVRTVTGGGKQVYREDYRNNLLSVHWDNRIGCAMAVRGSLVNYIAEHYASSPRFAHDMLCVFVSDIQNGGYVVDYPYINYRVHGGNASVYREKQKSLNEKIESLEKTAEDMKYYYDGVKDLESSDINAEMRDEFCKIMRFNALRAELLKKRSVFGIFKSKKEYAAVGKAKSMYADILDVTGLKKLLRRR